MCWCLLYYRSPSFKVALIDISIITTEQMAAWIQRDTEEWLARSDEPTESDHLNVQLPSALWSVIAGFSSLFGCQGCNCTISIRSCCSYFVVCGHSRQLFSAKLPKSPLYATYNRLKGQILPCGVSGDKTGLKESNSWIYIHQVVREEKTNHIMIMLLNESQQKN